MSNTKRCGSGLHYQVYAEFSFQHNKPKAQLVSTSISSTYAACTTILFQPFDSKPLTISRIFHTLPQAHSYIAYLHGVYPNSTAKPPVLDCGQKELF
jgi:hypothetical protein